jgi:hypothetical protein
MPHPERNRILEATFHSPATATPLLTPPRRGQHSRSASSLPRCLSVEIRSTRASRTATLDYGVSDLQPDARYLNVRAAHRRTDSTTTPLREFPSGSSCPAKPSCWWLAIRSVRSPFAPLQLADIIGFSVGSPFRVRFVPSGLLFLEPLGTRLSLPQVATRVNTKPAFLSDLPRFLFAL